MRTMSLAFTLSLMAAPALAQNTPTTSTPIQRAPTSEEMAVGVNWNNLQQSLGSMLQSLDKVIRENDALKLHNADMDAYLKACGDHAGCTSPVK